MTRKKRKMSHVDEQGAARMVDVGDKEQSRRTAIAEGSISMQPETLEAIRQNTVEKGDVLTVAKIAGINVGKRAAEWIPLCHPLQIDVIDVSLTLDDDLPGVKVTAWAGLTGRTGAEMEALVAASAALLTVYDMCKAVDRGMQLSVRLVEKSGGRSGTWQRRDS
jgi:cyclic pyranopterin phosphate synthase